jgi:hypothetical protein
MNDPMKTAKERTCDGSTVSCRLRFVACEVPDPSCRQTLMYLSIGVQEDNFEGAHPANHKHPRNPRQTELNSAIFYSRRLSEVCLS